MNKEKPLSYNNKGDLTKGPVKQHLIRLTIPMTWGILAIISMQLVDTYYVSLLGTQHLAAISFTFPVTYMIFSLLLGFGIAMSSVAARLIGEKETDTLQRLVSHGLILVCLTGIMISILGILFHDFIFKAMGADGNMLSLIRDYMIVYLAGSTFLALLLVSNSAMRATGDTLTPALIIGGIALANIILDPLLIFGLFGFPRLELEGAAIATVLAHACGSFISLYVLHAHKKMVRLKNMMHFGLFGDSIRRLLFIAVPVGLTNSIQPFVNGVIIALLATYGSEAVAAFGVVTRIEAFVFVILMALSTGMAPIIGQNWGAKKFGRVHETLKLAMGFNVAWSLLVAIVLGLLAKPIAGLFSDDPTIIGHAALFFWIVPISYAFSNLMMGWASAFNAMGMPQRSFFMIVFKMLVLMVPAVYIGNWLGDIKGIFLAIALVSGASGTIFHIWSWRTCLAREKTIQEQPA